MAWWGKVLGGTFGFILGGPLGAALGAALGHGLDKGLGSATLDPGEQERVQAAFFTATFSVLGHVAKADGRVSEEEIALARDLMDEMELNADMRRTAIGLFNAGKAADFPLDEVLEQFRRECHRRYTLLQMFLEIQLQAAYADDHLDPGEERVLLRIFDRLGFTAQDFWRLARMTEARRDVLGKRRRREKPRGPAQPAGSELDRAYARLGLSASATDAEVKQAYRRLTSQHHPDKLVAKGLPEEMMRLAAQKTHEIRQAYETIRTQRGMR